MHHGHDASLRRWRIDYFANELLSKGYTVEIVHMLSEHYSRECLDSDVIIFYRCYYPQSSFINKLTSMNKLVIYDIDDFVFQNDGKYNSLNDRRLILDYANNVNCLMASTGKLLEQFNIPKLNKIVRRNFIDSETFDLLNSEFNDDPNDFRIGWLTGINRFEMRDFIYDFLKKISSKDKRCSFYYFGKDDDFYLKIRNIRGIKICRLDYVNSSDWKRLYRLFSECRFSVVINPLDCNDIFMNCKSEIKFYECAPLMAPLITSPTWPFLQIVNNQVNGVFASTVDEFVDEVISLKQNSAKRKTIAANAYAMAKEMIENNGIGMVIDEIENAKFFLGNFCKKNDDKIIDKYNMPSYVVEAIEIFSFNILCKRDLVYSVSLPVYVVCDECILQVCVKHEDKIVADKVLKARRDTKKISVNFVPLEKSFNNYLTFDVKLISGNFSYYENFEHKVCCDIFYSNNDVNINNNGVIVKINSQLEDVIGLIPIAKDVLSSGKKFILETNCRMISSEYFSDVVSIGDRPKGNYRYVDLSGIIDKNVTSHYADSLAVSVLGHHLIDKSIDICVSLDDYYFINKTLKDNGLLGKKFAVFHENNGRYNRSWPSEKWSSIEAGCMAENIPVFVVGFGNDFTPKMPSAINLVNKLTFKQIRALLEKSSYVVTLDSFILQMCCNIDAKIIAIFLSTLPRYRVPYSGIDRLINVKEILPNISCHGCFHNGTAQYRCRKNNMECAISITQRMVIDAIINN